MTRIIEHMKEREMTIESSINPQDNKQAIGHAFIMTHSLFSDVIQIACCSDNPQQHAESLSQKTIGEYNVAFSIECNEPCKVKSKIKKYLNAQRYVNDFYQVSPDFAAKLLKRETLKITSFNL